MSVIEKREMLQECYAQKILGSYSEGTLKTDEVALYV